jgi:hypothetical protein
MVQHSSVTNDISAYNLSTYLARTISAGQSCFATAISN